MGVNNGTLGAATTANQTASYFLKNTQATDLTQDNFNVGWEHDINQGTSAGKLTFSIIPEWTDRIKSNDSTNLNCSFTSTFDNTKGGNRTLSIAITFNVQGG